MKRKRRILYYIILLITAAVGIAMLAVGISRVVNSYDRASFPVMAEEASHCPSTVPDQALIPPPAPAPTPAPTLTPVVMPEQARQMLALTEQVSKEMGQRENMFTRFIIPEAGINVALFTDGSDLIIPELRQGIVDEEDSALLYYEYESGCGVIADHNHQSFSRLLNVQPGQKAYFVSARSVIELECTRLINGHNNNHKSIVDGNYAPLNSPGDFICYTCLEDWQNVRIVVLDIIDEYFMN